MACYSVLLASSSSSSPPPTQRCFTLSSALLLSQSQGHGGADRSRGRQGRERLQADLGPPDGAAAGQLHGGVHQEPNAAVMEPNTQADIHLRALWLCRSSRHCRVYSSAPPPHRGLKSTFSLGGEGAASLHCKPIASSDAPPPIAPRIIPKRSTERCKKRPSGGHDESEQLQIDYPPLSNSSQLSSGEGC